MKPLREIHCSRHFCCLIFWSCNDFTSLRLCLFCLSVLFLSVCLSPVILPGQEDQNCGSMSFHSFPPIIIVQTHSVYMCSHQFPTETTHVASKANLWHLGSIIQFCRAIVAMLQSYWLSSWSVVYHTVGQIFTFDWPHVAWDWPKCEVVIGLFDKVW